MKFNKELPKITLWTLTINDKRHIAVFYFNTGFYKIRNGDYIYSVNKYYLITKMGLYPSLDIVYNKYERGKSTYEEFMESFTNMNKSFISADRFIVLHYTPVEIHNINLPKFYEDNNIDVRKFLLDGAKTIELFQNKPKYAAINVNDILHINILRHSVSGGNLSLLMFKVIKIKRYKTIGSFSKHNDINDFLPNAIDDKIPNNIKKSYNDYGVIAMFLSRIEKK